MKTLAYCAASFEQSVKKAAGVQPILSPPMTMQQFDPSTLEGYDFIYFKLHGMPAEKYWYGDSWITAISASQIKEANLSGSTVFVANCHLFHQFISQDEITSPMLYALLQAGAKAVVGGPGRNYASSYHVAGADKLGRAFRRFLQLKFPPDTALTLAQAQLAILKTVLHNLTPAESLALDDTFAFRIFTRGDL